MAQRKTIEEQLDIELKKEKELQNRISDLRQKQKEQNDKARTHRLCKRAGYLESILPDTIKLTDEHFYAFLDKTLATEYARKILAEYYEQDAPVNEESAAEQED